MENSGRDTVRHAYIVVVFALLVVPALASAQVVVFDKYSTVASIDGGSIHIEREVRIKNVGNTPIIPGELHFRLYEENGNEKTPIPASSLVATSSRGEKLPTKITERAKETDLSIQLWNPLLPGFHYEFTMSYDMEFRPAGILFYEIRLPKEETTIPIAKEHTEFVLEDKYHVTYAPGSSVDKLSGNTVISWDADKDSRVVEYSRIPLPRIGVRAVNVFWVVIIGLLVISFVLSLRRQRGGGKQKRPPVQQQQYYHQPQQQYQHPQQQQQPPPQYRPPGGQG